MTQTVEQAFSRALHGMLDLFRDLEAKGPASKPMAIQEAVAFLAVVERPGKTVNDYAQATGMSPTSMSRYLLDLGERMRTGEAGRGLIVGRRNVLDMREVQYFLTPKGVGFVGRLLGRLSSAQKGGD